MGGVYNAITLSIAFKYSNWLWSLTYAVTHGCKCIGISAGLVIMDSHSITFDTNTQQWEFLSDCQVLIMSDIIP